MQEQKHPAGQTPLTPLNADQTPVRKTEAEPIGLAEETAGQVAFKTFGAAARVGPVKSQLKRPLNLTGHGATRCRVFYSKIAVAPLEHLETQINDWLDGDKIEVKQVGHVIGNMVGKTAEPNLIVMVWF